MANEEVYQAVKNIFGRYAVFFKRVAQEVGIEKALELHAKAHEAMGVASGNLMKEQLGDILFDLNTLGPLFRDGNRSLGLELEMVEGPVSVMLKNARCPVYDGYRMAGLDEETAEAMCQKGVIAKGGFTLKQLNPDLTYRLAHYRSKPDESCVEEIIQRGN